jgi:hypothetical protein
MSNVQHGPVAEALPAPPGGSPEAWDWRQHRKAGVLIGLAAAAVVGLVVAVNAVHGRSAPGASASAASGMTGMPSGATTSSMGMSTPSAGAASSAGTAAGGVAMVVGGKATSSMPNTMSMTPLGQSTWDGMLIRPVATAPLPFILFDGTSQQVVNPTKNTSFHLMVALSDASTGYAIPYSSVWATITSSGGGKLIFDERLWPMISRYMGPHYGDNVDLPGPGTYKLTLLVSPPEAARHVEYKGLWLTAHRVSFVFHWQPQT